MKRDIRFSEKLLIAGLGFIFLFMIVQDWVPLGTLNDIQAIREEHSFNRLLLVTMINVGQILLLIGLIILFIGKRYPIWVRLWLIIHQICIFAGVLLSWWIPYFFGYGSEQIAESYHEMFGDTHTFLPLMNGIAPNTLHVLFHLTLLFCIIVTIYISTTTRKKEKYNNNLSENIS
ncbi:hypothetical protein [Gracilibacillus xinjiangensis]|uniref:Uncharacterized protein n=1 Tax=Gracilibacillus xinjiangensis TaxID=1193282 RepID=A0ABV8WVI9_9BACI